ncbi:MAG: hypothetical protein RR767_07515 [Acinetobacter sp.]
MNKKNGIHKAFALSALSMSIILLSQSVFALEELTDQALSNVNGQDGVDLSIDFDRANFDKFYWEDKAGTATNAEQTLRANANNVVFSGMGATQPGVNLKFNAASEGSKTGLDAQLVLKPFTMAIDSWTLCDTAATPACGGSLGSLGLQVASPMGIRLTTPNGLFSSTDQAALSLGLNNLNLFIGQKQSLAALTQNQLLSKLNFNLSGKGFITIDPAKGLFITTNQNGATTNKSHTPTSTLGYVDFDRVDDPNKSSIPTAQYGTYGATSSGINIELSTVKNATAGVYDASAAKGLIRVGASGRIVDGTLQIRGISAAGKINPTDNNLTNTHELNNVLGFANQGATTAASSTVIGSSGIGFRMRGSFTNVGDQMLTGAKVGKPTTLEIGGAGNDSYGFEFSNLTPLISGSAERAYFDSGDIFLNLANTQTIRLPENSVLRTARFGGIAGQYLTNANDYIQKIHNDAINPYSLILAIRGMNFQALSRQGRFTSSTGISTANAFTNQTNNWGLALPIYNLNANLATYAKSYTGDVYGLTNGIVIKSTVTDSQRLGLALALSTEGRDASGSKTTSIMVIDGSPVSTNGNKPTDYYLGLRNIDMLLRGYGSMGFENGNVNLTMPDLLMVMSAELAAGYLPGAKYKSYAYTSPLDNFKLTNDVLLGIKIKLLGDIGFALIPNNATADGNALTIVGDYKLTDGAIQLSDPVDGSMMGLDNISGKIRFNNSIVIGKNTTDYTVDKQGNVAFNYALNFNPDKDPNEVFRVKDINFYPPNSSNTTGQRLGEMVMTGGRLSSSLTLTPRN